MKRLLLLLLLWPAVARASALPTPAIACDTGTLAGTTCVRLTTASTTIQKPTHVVAGDLLVASCYVSPQSGTVNSLSGGATWNLVGTTVSIGSTDEFRTFWKVAADSEPSTYTLSVTGATGQGCMIQVYRGVAQSSPYESNIAENSGNGTSLTCGSITTSAADSIAVCSCITDAANSFTPAGSYTEEYDNTNGFFMSWRVYGSAGSTGAQTVTASTTVNWGCTHLSFSYNTAGVRIYLPSTGTPGVSPGFGGGTVAWEDTDQADRITAVFTKGSSAITSKTINEETGDVTSGADFLFRQYQIAVGAQTVSGVVQCSARAQEANAADNMRSQLAIRLADAAGTHQSVLLAHTTGGLTNEWATALTAANFPKKDDAHTLTSQSASNNDLLIIEFGSRTTNTASTARTHTMSFGENVATALDRDDAETTANYPWCDFLSGLQAPSVATCSTSLGLMGVGCR